MAIRNVRRDTMHHLRELKAEGEASSDDEHRAEVELQKLTDGRIGELDGDAQGQGRGDPGGVMAAASTAARYLAIITDGNGRWARAHGVPVNDGHQRRRRHRQGPAARRRRAGDRGVHRVLVLDRELVTRPAAEVQGLMEMFSQRIAAGNAGAARRGRADALHRAPRGGPAGPRRADGVGRRDDGGELPDHPVRGLQLRRPRGDPGRRPALCTVGRRRSSAPACTRPRCTTRT